MRDAANKYYVCLSYNEWCDEWSPYQVEASDVPLFYRGVLKKIEDQLRDRGLIFYVTWKLDELPSYGRNVVALTMGDEWSRVPDYSQKVLATFKCYGSKPFLGVRSWYPFSRLKLMLILKYLRNIVVSLPGALTRFVYGIGKWVQKEGWTPIIPIPLGYGNQMNLKVKPLAERGMDVFFAGSVDHTRAKKSSLKYWIQNPKKLARNAMIDALDRLAASNTSIKTNVAVTSSFTLNDIHYGTGDDQEILQIQEYSQAMMNAKICLVPRGTSPETYRFFEALRAGTIPIVEPLPPFSFYKEAPVVEIQDWNTLDVVIKELLADPARMEVLHQDGLMWWKEHCSEEAIAEMMVETIESHREPSTELVSA